MIGTRIRIKREEMGINMATLAKMVDSNSATIGQIELGKHTNPTLALVTKLADTFHVSIDWLVYGTQELVSKQDQEQLSEEEKQFIREYVEFCILRKKG